MLLPSKCQLVTAGQSVRDYVTLECRTNVFRQTNEEHVSVTSMDTTKLETIQEAGKIDIILMVR